MLHELSFANMILYSAIIPSYKSPKDKKQGQGKFGNDVVINGDDPANQDMIREFFGD